MALLLHPQDSSSISLARAACLSVQPMRPSLQRAILFLTVSTARLELVLRTDRSTPPMHREFTPDATVSLQMQRHWVQLKLILSKDINTDCPLSKTRPPARQREDT